MELATHRVGAQIRIIRRDLLLDNGRRCAICAEVRRRMRMRMVLRLRYEPLAREVTTWCAVAAGRVEGDTARPNLEAVLIAEVARVADELWHERSIRRRHRRVLEAAKPVLADREFDDTRVLVRLEQPLRLVLRHRRRAHPHPRSLDLRREARVREEGRLAERDGHLWREPRGQVDDVVGGAVEGQRHAKCAADAAVLHLLPDVVAVAHHSRQHERAVERDGERDCITQDRTHVRLLQVEAVGRLRGRDVARQEAERQHRCLGCDGEVLTLGEV
mmetsp:Transcript_9231/g.23611  ORF Transcript_9231/g.23611 Transcript_9231/m.23611 type:complete len:274 (-) Transcript_9231:992-1813(-)